MRKLWNDPVWSKVIAGLILAALAAIGSTVINNKAIPTFIGSWSPTAVTVNPTILIAVLLFLLFVGLAILLVNAFTKYDVFISAPMSFQDDANYKDFRSYCMEIKTLLETDCGFSRIYYAGETIESVNEFSAHQHAAENDLKALRKSKRFLLIVPEKTYSSSIFEAGFAFRKGIPSIYFCKKIDDLPFLMRKLGDVFLHVKVYEPNNGGMDDLKKYIGQQKRKLFSTKKA